MFLERRTAPDRQEQARLYAAILAAFAPRPVTIRTLDVGGDKPLAYLPLPREDNPALGLRGLRVGLRTPDLLREQFAAILAAAGQGQVRILLPMVKDVVELRAARALLGECVREARLTAMPALGVMIETPSAAVLADQFAREADFLSIGSNDLGQYVLAVDRTHPELGAQADGLHPAVLRLIAGVAEAARVAPCSLSICGGLASQADAVPLLIGLGVHELSVAPDAVPRIKRRIRGLSLEHCQVLARRALACEDAADVRALLASTESHPVTTIGVQVPA
jgi:phosphoenolpyruvate-protein kinase (PTS system EI component)